MIYEILTKICDKYYEIFYYSVRAIRVGPILYNEILLEIGSYVLNSNGHTATNYSNPYSNQPTMEIATQTGPVKINVSPDRCMKLDISGILCEIWSFITVKDSQGITSVINMSDYADFKYNSGRLSVSKNNERPAEPAPLLVELTALQPEW